MVLASEILLLNTMEYDGRYLIISLMFMVGYALIFWKGETNDRVGEKTNGD